jgi:hypothetical protein
MQMQDALENDGSPRRKLLAPTLIGCENDSDKEEIEIRDWGL